MTDAIQYELTARDVIDVVDSATGGCWFIRCNRRPVVDDCPDNPVATWDGTLHDPDTDARVAVFTVPDHYAVPFIDWVSG